MDILVQGWKIVSYVPESSLQELDREIGIKDGEGKVTTNMTSVGSISTKEVTLPGTRLYGPMER